MGEVLEQDVDGVGRAVRALELLARQDRLVGLRRTSSNPCLADHDPEVLQPHPVDALVDGRDELDERDDLAFQDFERLGENDQGDRAAVPDVLPIRGRVALEERPDLDVLVPLT